jgi:hypothetical protein
LTATPNGPLTSFTVDMTVFVAVSITEIVLPSHAVTYTFVPAELTATPKGLVPTFTTAVTLFVIVSITETVLLPEFVIKARGPIDKEFCTLDAEAIEEVMINKMKIIEARDVEHNFCLVINCFSPLCLFLKNIQYKNKLKIFKCFIEILNRTGQLRISGHVLTF